MNTQSSSVLFTTSNQSIWDIGQAFRFQDNRFLGTSWDKSLRREWGGKRINFAIAGSTDGELGLQSRLALQSGTLDASLPMDLWFNLPSEVQPGDEITIQSGFNLAENSVFSTLSPNITYDLDLLVKMNALASLTGQLGRKNFQKKFDWSIPAKQIDLLTLSAAGSEFTIPEDRLKGFGRFTLRLPKIDTQGKLVNANRLSSNGSDTFFTGALDLDKIAIELLKLATKLKIPDLEGKFEKEILTLSLQAAYNLLDADLQAKLGISQIFDLIVRSLPGKIILETGEKIPFQVGQNLSITVPEGIGSTLDFQAVFKPDAIFKNQSKLTYDVDLLLEALSLSGRLKGKLINEEFKLGPLLKKTVDIFNGNVSIYGKQFNIAGWNQQSLNFNIKSFMMPEILPVTNNAVSDSNPVISGDHILWARGTQLYDYNIQTGVTRNISIAFSGDAYNFSYQIDSPYAVWLFKPSLEMESAVAFRDLTTESARIFVPSGNFSSPQISDTNVVWISGTSSHASDILYRDASVGMAFQTLSNAAYNDSPSIAGNHVVWVGGMSENQVDHQIFHYDLETDKRTIISTGTNRSYRDPDISGTGVVWSGLGEDGGDDLEIFYHDLETGQTFQVTNNDTYDKLPQIQGDNLVWQASDSSPASYYDNDSEVFYLDLSKRDPITGQPTNTAIQLTNNDVFDGDVQVDGKSIIWRQGTLATHFDLRYRNLDYERTVTLGKNIGLSAFSIDEGRIVWSAGLGDQSEIFLATIDQMSSVAPIATEI